MIYPPHDVPSISVGVGELRRTLRALRQSGYDTGKRSGVSVSVRKIKDNQTFFPG